MWLVLDQSKAGDGPYDVVHVDLNGDGDLTDSGERIKATSASGNREATSAQFSLGEFTDPATGDKHTNLKLRLSGGGSRPLHMLSLKWRDKHRMGGGYAEQSAGGYMRFAPSAKEAPIVWFNGDGPFQFQRWYSESLRIGQADDLKLFLGQLGVGKNTFCAFSEHVLPAGEGVKATLIYADKQGKEHRELYELKERC